MNDFIITVNKSDRSVTSKTYIGNDGENLQDKLVFKFNDSFVSGLAHLDYERDSEKFFIPLEKENETYVAPIKKFMLKEGSIDMQLVIEEEGSEVPIFKSDIFTLYCKKSINSTDEEPEGFELWLEQANKILYQANNVNITAQKENNKTIIKITDKTGFIKTIEILDGKDGATPDLSNYVQKSEFNTSQDDQDTTIEGLQAELEKYKLLENALPHTENATPSDYVTLEDTAKAPMEIETIPQTSQETTTGKNLLPLLDGTITANGITITIENGIVTINGTATAGITFKLTNGLDSSSSATIPSSWLEEEIVSNKNNTTFSKRYDSGNGATTGCAFRIYGTSTTQLTQFYPTQVEQSVTYTEEGKVSNLVFFTNANYTFNDYKFKLQLENGSSVTDWEKFTFGPSPNPDYPQEIHRTTGDNQVKVVGKNLFDKDGENFQGNIGINNFNGKKIITNSVVGNNVYNLSNNNARAVLYFKGIVGETYYLSFNSAYNIRTIKAFNESGIITDTLSTRNLITMTTDFAAVIMGKTDGTDFTDTQVTELKDSLQIEQSSTASSYLPYEETTYPISLGNKELYNINGVYDGFVYDEATDKFYINRMNGKTVFNGSENGWSKGTNNYNISQSEMKTTNVGFGLSNYFTNARIDYSYTAGKIRFGWNNSRLYFYVDMTSIAEIENWKSWLSTHNTIVVYQLATSTLEEITDSTLISQLRAIKNALSMQGTTHIISTASGSNLPFLIKARAVQTIERT